jgi:DNA-binding NarL/FixJ family response regulator
MQLEEHILSEIKRISLECRLQSRGSRPQLALLRASEALNSLIASLATETLPHSPLTHRESEILFHVSQGFTNRDIASALSISEKTIEFHLKSIFQKTEASSRTEAATTAIKNKWLE